MGRAIQSVLTQTLQDLELIIIDDASPQPIAPVVQQIQDPRVHYIVHSTNQGLSAARNTGISAARAEVIALLDGDDWFHPQKLELHHNFLQEHPQVGVSFNARFELNHSSETIRDMWCPPLRVTLADLVMGFPFSPSDMVIRREWALGVNMFDVRYTYVGEDLDINCRLALAGCQFEGIGRALNYRRYHSGRVNSDLKGAIQDTIRPLIATFSDPRCPQAIVALKNQAFAQHYLLWSIIALMQDETEIGQGCLLEAVSRFPPLLELNCRRILETMIFWSVMDENLDHGQVLKKIFDQLPAPVTRIQPQYARAVGRGYLLKGTRAIFWKRGADGAAHLAQAAKYDAVCDESYIHQVTQQLLNYEAEFDQSEARQVFTTLVRELQAIGQGKAARYLEASYSINRAFGRYQRGDYATVPCMVIQAVSRNPRYLANRGVLSMFVRSLGILNVKSIAAGA